MTALSVNLNKVALVRNSRGGSVPDLEQAARVCVAAGCQGITLHPRPDQRHARPADCRALKAWLPVELNLEGNPFEGPRGGYPGFLELVREVAPSQCTLVPDDPGQLTSDHGWDLDHQMRRLQPVIADLRQRGIRVSLFMDAGSDDLERAAELGADRIEIYTGPFAHAFAGGDPKAELDRCAATARRAAALGLGVNAGHDLDRSNLAAFLAAVPGVLEVSIGHALISEALFEGLASVLRDYLALTAAA